MTSSSEAQVFDMESRIRESGVTAPRDRYSIEDMYTFDQKEIDKVDKPIQGVRSQKSAKAVRSKKEASDPSQITKKRLERAMKVLAKIGGDGDTTEGAAAEVEQQSEAPATEIGQQSEATTKNVKAPVEAVLRFPSPSRSRQQSPQKARQMSTGAGCQSAPPMASDATTSEKQFHHQASEVADDSKDPCQGGVKEKIKKFEQKEVEKRHSLSNPRADQGGNEDRIKRFELKETEKTSESNELSTLFSRINALRTVKDVQTKAEAEAGDESNNAPIQDNQMKAVTKDASASRDAPIPVNQLKAVAQEGSASHDPQIPEHQAQMDKTLKQCFLQAISTRLLERDFPIEAMTLYEKHMRMCRPIDSNCNVQDSSFVSLKAFFQSLEDAGLVELESSSNEDTPKVIAVNRNHPSVQAWQPWPHKTTIACLRCRGKR